MREMNEGDDLKFNSTATRTFKGRIWKAAIFDAKISNLPHLKNFRKQCRSAPTPAEYRLWFFLKGRALAGRKFRRQFSIGNYILDFYCVEEKLVIELDGAGHSEEKQKANDKKRDSILMQEGIKVLRFENSKVFDDVEGLLEVVRESFLPRN